jgi:hypothetical protein
MKFNPKLPHGTITGHAWAQFEQDGVLFGSDGFSKSQSTDRQEPTARQTKTFARSDAQAFLRVILAGGPVAKASIYKEADANNQRWSDVSTAFAEMRGVIFKQGKTIVWRLSEESTA